MQMTYLYLQFKIEKLSKAQEISYVDNMFHVKTD